MENTKKKILQYGRDWSVLEESITMSIKTVSTRSKEGQVSNYNYYL
jgi:hypothetical protein